MKTMEYLYYDSDEGPMLNNSGLPVGLNGFLDTLLVQFRLQVPAIHHHCPDIVVISSQLQVGGRTNFGLNFLSVLRNNAACNILDIDSSLLSFALGIVVAVAEACSSDMYIGGLILASFFVECIINEFSD
jgi:hypothetical protein